MERLIWRGRPSPNILLVSTFLRAAFAWQAALKQNKGEVGCDDMLKVALIDWFRGSGGHLVQARVRQVMAAKRRTTAVTV